MLSPRSTTAFSGVGLDRASVLRTDAASVERHLRAPASSAIAVTRDSVFVTDGPALAYFELGPLRAAGAGEPLLLGLRDEHALFAVDADGLDLAVTAELAPGARPLALREAGELLSQADGGLAAYATALAGWHRRHPHCAVCGARTEIAEAGHVRACPNCGAVHHPRTDPVVIMLVTDGDRALLGRQPSWPTGRYSALAGFVEPGEALEEAVAREVREESGVEIDGVEFLASQPWPFPGSLMVAFQARYAAGEPAIGDGELDDVRWFGRDELLEAAAGRGPVHLPGRVAIARQLIDAWLGATPPP